MGQKKKKSGKFSTTKPSMKVTRRRKTEASPKKRKFEAAVKEAIAAVKKAENKIAEGRDELRDAMCMAQQLVDDTDQAMLDIEQARRSLECAADQISQTV